MQLAFWNKNLLPWAAILMSAEISSFFSSALNPKNFINSPPGKDYNMQCRYSGLRLNAVYYFNSIPAPRGASTFSCDLLSPKGSPRFNVTTLPCENAYSINSLLISCGNNAWHPCCLPTKILMVFDDLCRRISLLSNASYNITDATAMVFTILIVINSRLPGPATFKEWNILL